MYMGLTVGSGRVRRPWELRVEMIKAIRGFKDILPDETGLWQEVEAAAARVLRAFGYQEIRVPVVERTELFARSIGSDTDIVEKEMYSFPDRHDASLTLRPEATAGVVRAVIEHNLAGDGRPLKLWFMGPMFRYERPQKGRQRQFHQLDVEVFNDPTPHMDAEIIILLDRFLGDLGLADVEMHVNSLGCPVCRPDYKETLKVFLRQAKSDLCPDCQRRLETNPLRVLDCKVPRCADIVRDSGAPKITDHLCPDCRAHDASVWSDLGRAGLTRVHRNPFLVRGLDYYSRTTFEARTGELGAQNAVAGGGRYDGLVRSLGGPDVPGIGFAVGLERLTMLLAEQSRAHRPGPDLYVAALDDAAVEASFGLVQATRSSNVTVEIDYQPGSLKSRMKRADKLNAAWVLILGPEELAGGQAILRNMATKEQPFFRLEPEAPDRAAARLTEVIVKPKE